MGKITKKMLDEAHEHCYMHKDELMKSRICGCFNCMATFRPEEIENFIDDGQTAQCPECSIDAVIGDASGFPITNEFLLAMYERWF